jgi:protein-disulfide isomerase
VNELIGTYLKEHPEAIIDSLRAYQLKEEIAREEEKAKTLQEVLPELTGNDHHYGEAGNPKGDVTIVEFFDYNCPACKMMFESLDALLIKDKKVRLIFVELPIFGPTSDENAKISMAVNALKPEKFYLFHQAAMRHKGKISPEEMLNIAQGLGLDKDAIKKEAAKDKYTDLIAKDRKISGKLSIQGTPANIIGGKFYGGALTADQLEEAVEEARKANKK